MKSYILGIVVAMILSVAYALSNTAEITVKFFNLQTTFPQGMWEVIVFALGILIMGLISICESIESYVKNRKKTKELTKRIAQLEDERKSLLTTLGSFGWKYREEDEPHALPEPDPKYAGTPQTKAACDFDFHPGQGETRDLGKPELYDAAEPQKNAEVKPSFLKTFILSVFKRAKNTEAEQDAMEPVLGETGEQTAHQENVCSIPENVCLIPEPDTEEHDAAPSAEIEDEEKSEI
jgi:uncharacterized integral membrane protein